MIGAAGSSGRSRDFGLLFTDPSGSFSEGNPDCTSIVDTMEDGVPAIGKGGSFTHAQASSRTPPEVETRWHRL
jgi:hypothetical protein